MKLHAFMVVGAVDKGDDEDTMELHSYLGVQITDRPDLVQAHLLERYGAEGWKDVVVECMAVSDEMIREAAAALGLVDLAKVGARA